MYLNEVFGGDWSYHNYRDCDITNYLKAMEYIAEQGGYAVRMGDLFLPKKIRNIAENRLLTFPEIFDHRIGKWLNGRNFIEAGMEVIENTPDEILGLVREMNESFDGIFNYTEEDKELQYRYHFLIKPHHLCFRTPAKIGTLFLRENKHLLYGCS